MDWDLHIQAIYIYNKDKYIYIYYSNYYGNKSVSFKIVKTILPKLAKNPITTKNGITKYKGYLTE